MHMTSKHHQRANTEGSQLNNSHITSSSNMTLGGATKEPPKAYEEMLQKLEGDIRNHIRIE